jgi:hypothetical protein
MKKFIYGLIISGILVLSSVQVGWAQLIECGISQLYCVQADGSIHGSVGLSIGNRFAVDPDFSLVPYFLSPFDITTSVIVTEALRTGAAASDFLNSVTMSNDCIDCDGYGQGRSNRMTYGVNNVGGSGVFGDYVDMLVTVPAGVTVPFAVVESIAWAGFHNLGTINNYVFLYLSPADIKNDPEVGILGQIWGIEMDGASTAVGGDIAGLKNNLAGITIIGIDATSTASAPSTSLVFQNMLFADLIGAPNGTMAYCSDCTFANPCAGAGTGSFAKRLNGAWRCD